MSNLLRIVSWNIHKGFSQLRRNFVLHELRGAIHEISPDLVFLQEIIGENRRHAKRLQDNWPQMLHAEFVASDLFEHAYEPNAWFRHGDHGNALLSRFPISSVQQFNISTNPIEQRGFLHVKVELEGLEARSLHCLSIHLGLFARSRKKQLEMVAEYVRRHVPSDHPLVIAGDFNDWKIESDRYLYQAMGMKEAFRELYGSNARTFPSKVPALCLDRIYVRNLRIVEGRIFQGKRYSRLSDHLPICAELSFK